jgi:hypothetical protein
LLLHPVVVVVMVAAGDAGDPQTRAMVHTLERSLEAGSNVLVQETGSVPSDLAAEAAAKSQSAESVIVIAWPGRYRARVRVRSTSGTWATREMQFAPSDQAEERGRTVGLIAATMVPGELGPPPPPPPPPRPLPRGMVGLGLVIAPGLDSNVWGLGPDASGGVRVGGPIWIDAHIQGRFGRHAGIAAGAQNVLLEIGLAARLFPGRFVVGARLGFGAAWVELRRGADADNRWYPVLSVPLEVGWVPGPVGVILSVGPEFSLGNTRVQVDDQRVDPLPTARLRAEISGRFFF